MLEGTTLGRLLAERTGGVYRELPRRKDVEEEFAIDYPTMPSYDVLNDAAYRLFAELNANPSFMGSIIKASASCGDRTIFYATYFTVWPPSQCGPYLAKGTVYRAEC